MIKTIISLALVAFLFVSLCAPLEKDASSWLKENLQFAEMCLLKVRTVAGNIMEYREKTVGEKLDYLLSKVADAVTPTDDVSIFLHIQNFMRGN